MQQQFGHYAASRAHRDRRRRHRRTTLRVTAQVIQGQRVERRWTRDISEGGMRLETTGFDESSEVKVFLPIPERAEGKVRMWVLHARVAWRKDGECGLQFLNPPSESRLAIARFLAEQLR